MDGEVRCEGSFEPFGTDYQQGTMAGASENGLFLRLPGQWDDGTWADATSGAGIYYNVHRWLEYQAGRYVRPDPLGTRGGLNLYVYAESKPSRFLDPLGLAPCEDCDDCPSGLWIMATAEVEFFDVVLGGFGGGVTFNCIGNDLVCTGTYAGPQFGLGTGMVVGSIGTGIVGYPNRVCNKSDLEGQAPTLNASEVPGLGFGAEVSETSVGISIGVGFGAGGRIRLPNIPPGSLNCWMKAPWQADPNRPYMPPRGSPGRMF